jgi:hypothetical protein
MHPDDLVGTWRLVSFESRDEEGAVTYPYGRGALGYISYSADGYVFVAICAADRRPFAGGDAIAAAEGELAEAARTYRSYVARYELRGGRVLHHFELSLFPNRIGTTEERVVEYDGRLLRLSTPPMPSAGAVRTHHLVWERVVPRSLEEGRG